MKKILKRLFRDDYLRNNVAEVLKEVKSGITKIEETQKDISDLKEEINMIENRSKLEVSNLKLELEELKNRYNMLLLNQFNSQKKIKNPKKHVLFLIHNMSIWTALSGIYEEMKERKDVEVFVLAIQAQENSSPHQKSYSSNTEKYLKEERIKYDKINPDDIDRFLAYMTSINPDYVIRQSPWDADIPWMYSSMNLARYKLIYIPYHTLDITENFKPENFAVEINQNFHLCCDKIYCLSENQLEKAKKTFIGRKEILKFLGNTKFEYITKHNQVKSELAQSPMLKILWAPHHSLNDEWIAFGTFEKNCLEFIEIAKKYKDKIHIRLRKHPLLEQSIRRIDEKLYDKFLAEWEKLENTSIDDEWNYLKSFDWSDILITDGVSFIAEYPFTGKPVLFIENEKHLKFNRNGEICKEYSYVIKNNFEIYKYIDKILNNELKIKREVFLKMKNEFLKTINASKNIVNDILD